MFHRMLLLCISNTVLSYSLHLKMKYKYLPDVMDLQESALAHNHYLPIVFLFLFYLYWNMLIPASQSQTAYSD